MSETALLETDVQPHRAEHAVADQRLIEQGNPMSDARAFRRCLGQYPTGVSVITAKVGDKQVGMAVNSFAAVSLDPPLVLWSIRRESSSAPVFLDAPNFAINVLSVDQVETSQMFGASHPDRFKLTRWAHNASDALLIDGAIAHLECRRITVYEGGDHWILIGHVERYARFEGEPLLFSQGQYAVTQNHPSQDAAATAQPCASSERQEWTLLGLLNAANHELSTLFDEHRVALGVNGATGRVLNRLNEAPRERSALEQATYLGEHALDDALREVMAKGLVVQRGRLLALTPEGIKKRSVLAECAANFAVEKFSGISDADIATVKRVLLQLLQKPGP